MRERLRTGDLLAPSLREVQDADGQRMAVLDLVVAVEPAQAPHWALVERVLGVDWGVHTLITATAITGDSVQSGRPFFLDTGGVDGRQARTRRQIDELKAKVARYAAASSELPVVHPRRVALAARLARWRGEIARCWRKYARRNRALAHLASNVVLLLARLHGCQLIAMESLTTLKSTGRGKGVRGRWRNYRNNTTLRGEIWRLLKYKCRLVGVRFRTVAPRGTSHSCPRCGAEAATYRAPDERGSAVRWGRWLWCEGCGFNGDRDYCAAVNIARLGMTYLKALQETGRALRCAIRDPGVKPASYTGAGAVLLLPPPGRQARPPLAGSKCYYPGWAGTVLVQSSLPRTLFPWLSG